MITAFILLIFKIPYKIIVFLIIPGKPIKKIPKKQPRKNRRLANDKKRKPEGDIYFIHPSHVVAKKDLFIYQKKKGNLNSRPVAITDVKNDRTVSVSQIYGTPGKAKNITYKNRIRLSETNLKKKSWIDTSKTLNKSMATGKNFELNKTPLTKKTGKMHPNDLEKLRNAQAKKTKKATK